MNNDEPIIVFRTYYDPLLAEIIRTRLTDAGINSFLDDQNTIGANPFYNQALGGIKLKIFERDREKCERILAEDVSLPDDFSEND